MDKKKIEALRRLCTECSFPWKFVWPDTICVPDEVRGGDSALGFFVSTHGPKVVELLNALPELLDIAERDAR